MRRRSLTGEVLKIFDAPVWEPLLEVVGDELIDGWMWMFSVELEDGMVLQAYKHRDTRCYLHLDPEGNAYDYHHETGPDGGYGQSWYTEIPALYAFAGAMWAWPVLSAGEDDLERVEERLAELLEQRAAA